MSRGQLNLAAAAHTSDVKAQLNSVWHGDWHIELWSSSIVLAEKHVSKCPHHAWRGQQHALAVECTQQTAQT